MKLLLVMPNASIRLLKLGSFRMSFREAPLTLTTLAALIPEELNIETSLIDESVEDLNFNLYKDYDLIGISIMTGTSVRGFEIADRFQEMGIKVVVGGVHVTSFPEEAKNHADSTITGFAERVWPIMLKDFCNNELKPRYSGCDKDLLEHYPIPRRELQRNRRYAIPNTVMATRGCSNTCDFCSVPVYIKGHYKRPIKDIVNEVSLIKATRVAFNDVNMVEDLEWSKELLKKLAPLKKIWGGLATFQIYKDKEMMRLLQKSGCRYLLIGFESASQDTLRSIYKGFNKVDEYYEGMKVFHDHGIMIQGCFVFGFDHDKKDIFKQTVDLVNDLKIDIPRYAIYTPYPGTKLFQRLEDDKRIISKNYQLYDTQHVVYQPKLMTPVELYEGFRWAYRETFKLSSIARRTIRSTISFPITFVGNLAYKIYVKELYSTDKFVDSTYYQNL